MKNGDHWQEMISAFEAYWRQNGDGLVPASYPENPTLGRWVAMIRYRRKVGELEPAFIAELDSKGFCWSSGDQVWETMFKKLLAFRAKSGHCDMPANQTDVPLASWVARQRHARKLGTLSEERTLRLTEIGFRWNVYGRNDKEPAEPQRVEKSTAPQAAAPTPPTTAEEPEPAEERLYHIGADGYVQYDGTGELPVKLQRYLACHDDWPPHISVPTALTRFVLWIDGSSKARRVAWKGRGPLPADIIQYVKENGCLPPQA